MIYSIIYEAVKKKSMTNPPNRFIANVEMAAAGGIILGELGLKFDEEKQNENIDTPELISETIISLVSKRKDDLSEQGKILFDLIQKYQVKKMVNETMEDLLNLVNNRK